ncbi:MAG: FAD-dependent oxidoreductase [Candidatus Buchananbacteria bacterium]
MYEVIILGGGPAGLTAAIYCGRQQLKTLLLIKNIGGQTALSHCIQNFPGFLEVSGLILSQKMLEQVKALSSVEIKIAVEAVKISALAEGYQLTLADQTNFLAKTVIIAAGKNSRQLNAVGEKEFYGKGVTYCATCDGPLFKNKPVAVVGGGNSGLAAALQLAAYCPQVYLIEALPDLRGERVRQEQVLNSPNIQVLTGAKVQEIIGDRIVQGIVVEHEQQTKTLAVNGVFVEIGYVPATEWLQGIVELNDKGEIKINEKNATSVPGIFAAGDITDTPYKQTVIAAGEGAKAAMSATELVLGKTTAW